MVPFKSVDLCNADFVEENLVYFNYNLSRARVRVEQLFGILKSRFRFLNREMGVGVDLHVQITHAICILHNLSIDYGDLNVEYWLSSRQNATDLENTIASQVVNDFQAHVGPIVHQSDLQIRREGQRRRLELMQNLILLTDQNE